MEIVETPVFTKAILQLLPDNEYQKLQHYLVCRPDAGVLISGGSGLRKIRWSLPGQGKRGGIRTIYYWNFSDTIFMLYCYQKNEQENLTQVQLAKLRNYVKEGLC